MTWTEITPSYAGQFFRAEGRYSEKFGQVQNENAPQITKVHHRYVEGRLDYHDNRVIQDQPNFITLEKAKSDLLFTGWADKWSKDVVVGSEAIQFSKTFGEVRPLNSAIKIWERTA